MATNKDASAQDPSTSKEFPRYELSGKPENPKSTECCGNEADPVDVAGDLLRIAEDPSLSLHERFREVDKAADRLLAAFPGPRTKPAEEDATEETDDATYESTSDAVAEEYINSFIAQAKDVIEIGLDKIVEGLSVPDRVLPEEAIRKAQKHRELIIPRLIEVLETAAATATEDEPYKHNAHFFAIFLLAEFEAEEAFPAIRKILSLPDGLPYELFGDAVSEYLPEILAPFTGDRPGVLEEMMSDISLDESVRCGAAMTIASLVAAERLSWKEGVRMLVRGIAKDVEENDALTFDYFCQPLSAVLPWKVIERIEDAIELDVDDHTSRIMEIADEAIADPRSRRDPSPLGPEEVPCVEDTLDELRGWACFQDDDDDEEELADEDEELIRRLWQQEMDALRDAHSPPAPHFLEEREELAPVSQPIVSGTPRTGRNQLCPCGSGKKYKKCCGARR